MIPSIRLAEEEDRELLYEMNLRLMEDERYDRPPSEDDLRRRWEEFLELPRYGVFIFEITDEIVGYAVVHMDESPRYLRHYFIRREHRREGLGTACFHVLLSYLKTDRIDLDVMSWNQRGQAFWESLGFIERCRVLSYQKKEESNGKAQD